MAVIEGFTQRSTQVRRESTPSQPAGESAPGAGANVAVRHRIDGFDEGGGRPAQLQGGDLKSAEEAISNGHGARSALPVVEWLRAHPAQGDAFMRTWAQYGAVMGETLNRAQALGDADRRELANALGAAYRNGAVTDADVRNMVATYGRGALPGETHETLGELVGMTHNPALIARYAEAELAAMKSPDGAEPQRATAIAEALSGLQPDALQAFLAAHPGEVTAIAKLATGHLDAEDSDALAHLLDAANRIQPPTAESLALFTEAVPALGANAASRAAAARFFESNADAWLASLQDASGSLTQDGAKRVSELFARTLFTEPGFEGDDAFRRAVMSKLQDLTVALNVHASDPAPPDEVQRQARLMGSLTGAIEGGFQIAVDELHQRNQSVDGMVKLLFSAKDLIPALRVPGADVLKNLTFEQLQRWVQDALHEKPQSAADAIPFHTTFGESLGSPYLRTLYDAARGTTFDNRAAGL